MNVIIIGAGNTGFEIAKTLTKGNSILLIARHLPEHLKEFMKNNKNVFFALGDATSLDNMKQIQNSETIKEFGNIDLLICTVGTDSESTPLDNFEGFRQCFNINYYANLIPIKVFLKQMCTMNKGKIIILSASSGHHAPQRLQGYSPSKWALENTYSSLREEVKDNNISVDVVVVRTLKNKYSKVWIQNHGDDPEDVAKYINRIIANPKNTRHFFPKRYVFVRLLERLFPGILEIKYHRFTKRKRRKLYIHSKINSALITGAASGLGKELARCYSKKVETLNLIDKDWNGLVELQKDLAEISDCKVNINKVDISNQKDIINYTSKIDNVDLIINNAATSYVGNVQDVPNESYKQNFNINFFGPVLLSAEFLKKIPPPKKIINILSTTAIRGRKAYSPYSSAKAALWSFTRSLRRVYGKRIQIVEVIPSRMWETNYDKNMIKFEAVKKSTQSNPTQNRPSLQAKIKFLHVNNWTSEKAARKICKEEMGGKEIIMIPPIRAKLFLICETISDRLFRKIFEKK